MIPKRIEDPQKLFFTKGFEGEVQNFAMREKILSNIDEHPIVSDFFFEKKPF